MDFPPDIDMLARRYLELWDRQAAHLASAPASAALLVALARRSGDAATGEGSGSDGGEDGG